MRRRQLITWLTLAPIAACRSAPAPAPDSRPSRSAPAPQTDSDDELATVELAGVPHVRQKPDFCGEAAAAAYLQALGAAYRQDHVFALTGMSPERGMGATTRELKRALERIGLLRSS